MHLKCNGGRGGLSGAAARTGNLRKIDKKNSDNKKSKEVGKNHK